MDYLQQKTLSILTFSVTLIIRSQTNIAWFAG